MMGDATTAGDVALGLCIAGLLFLVRCWLALRRIERPAGGNLVAGFRRIVEPNAFGVGAEPERRHALRQLLFGSAFMAAGSGLAGFLLVADVLGPFFRRAGGGTEW